MNCLGLIIVIIIITVECKFNDQTLTVEEYNEFNFPNVPPTARLFYSNSKDIDQQQFGDLYIPEDKGPHPVVILIHGGCYVSSYGLERLGLLCKDLQSHGYAVWNLEYRRLGNGGGFPTTFMDIANGADFLRNIADSYNLDLNRVVVVGHSAGGHFGLWLTARTNLDRESILYSENPLRLGGVVNLAGIPTLEDVYKYNTCENGALITQLMGGTPQETKSFSQGSLKSLRPTTPQIVIQGLQDVIVPFEYEKEYVEFERSRGGKVLYFVVFDYTGHLEVILPSTPAGNSVKKAVDALLSEEKETTKIQKLSEPSFFKEFELQEDKTIVADRVENICISDCSEI